MIHDAYVPVTCDNESCAEEIEIQLDWVYANWSPSSGHYDADDASIEKKLAKQGWAVTDGHLCPFCSNGQ